MENNSNYGKTLCIMCSHCENIDIEAGTGVCGPLEGETVLLDQPCQCFKETIDMVERLQAEAHPPQPPTLDTYRVVIKKTVTGHVDIQATSEREAFEQVKQKYSKEGVELPEMEDESKLKFSIDASQKPVWVVDSKHYSALLTLVNAINARAKTFPLEPHIPALCAAFQSIASPTTISALDSDDKFAWVRSEIKSINPSVVGIATLAVYQKDGKLWNNNCFDGPWEISSKLPIVLFRAPHKKEIH